LTATLIIVKIPHIDKLYVTKRQDCKPIKHDIYYSFSFSKSGKTRFQLRNSFDAIGTSIFLAASIYFLKNLCVLPSFSVNTLLDDFR